MRLKHGGFTPKIDGRPVGDITTVPMPDRLILELKRNDITYEPAVQNGRRVDFGEPLATAAASGGTLVLPAPATGQVVLDEDRRRLVMQDPQAAATATGFSPLVHGRISSDEIKKTLARGGVWPFFYSSRDRGMPSLVGEEKPRSIVVNFILTEPFRARGKVVITRSWDRIVAGIRFLQRLVSDYGTIEIILTDRKHPVAQMMYNDLKGQAWVRFHSVPLTYPIENPRLLSETVRSLSSGMNGDDDIWVIDAQGIEAVGGCLGEGLPLHERIVVTGGPSAAGPRHFAVRIGTPLDSFVETIGSDATVLRGGLLNGAPVSVESAGVGYDDDAFFAMPRSGKRELLSFVRPGFGRTSYTRSFATSLFGGYDKQIAATLRGEPRPCIACGFCETVCPAGIMPQVIHRYLYREKTEEAEQAGLDRCVECNLCTYVCPSKIELRRQFTDAKAFIQKEKEEMLAVAARSGGGHSEGEEAK